MSVKPSDQPLGIQTHHDRDLDQDHSHHNDANTNGRDDHHYDSPVQSTLQEPTPLPKLPLFVLSIVIFTEPVSSSILFPFVYFMVRDFHITENEEEIGFYCGLIASSFFFAQFCTAIFWGYMSDRYGRRPIILLGLCGSTIASISFGFSKSLAWAIVSRSMCGLLNGNVGVAKSMLAEVSDSTNQSQAFSVFGFAWGMGMIVGPVLGGYLANPAKNFPDIFGDWDFFIEYPYFLPCFTAAMITVVGFVAGYFFLDETKGKVKEAMSEEDLDHNNQERMDTTYGSGQNFNAPHEPASSFSENAASTGLHDVDAERQPLVVPPSVSQPGNLRNRQGLGRSTQYGSVTTTSSPDPKSNDSDPKDRKVPPLAIASIIAYAVLALHSIILEEVFTLFALTPLISHGLGWNAIQLSTSLAIMGLVQLLFQFIVYPALGRRFSAVWLFRISHLLYVASYISFPLIRAFAIDQDDMETGGQIPRVRYMILTSLAIKYTSSVFAYTSVMVMITNSSPAHLLGMVNGIGQTSASLVRAVGPAMGGIFWAWSLSNGLHFPFNYYFVFIFLSSVAAFGFFYSLTIPTDLGFEKV